MEEPDARNDFPDATSSGVSEYNVSESLLHLINSYQHQDDKAEAEVHPMANLDMLTGQHRGPAVPLELLEENPRVCITCGVNFKTKPSLHAHLMRHRHILGTLEQFTRLPKYECRSCDGGINCSSMLKHKCFSNQQNDIRNRINALDRDGSPLVCILCRGRLFPSRVHLIIHIIVAHSIHRDPYKCVFCQAQFQSENLMMQEVHAFDCHAPELFMITRKACFKMIRNNHGVVANAAVPFICFYDATKLEGTDLGALFKAKSRRGENFADSDHTGNDEFVNIVTPKKRLCTATFNTLDEYTAHLCCFHGAVTPEHITVLEDDDPIEEVRRRTARTNRVPGPTVREMLKSQTAGHHATSKTDDEFVPSVTLKPTISPRKQSVRHTRSDSTGPAIRPRGLPARSLYSTPVNRLQKTKEMCRICLEYFPDEQKLSHHVTTYHTPESKKRLKHLAEKRKLSGILDIDLLCTECYIMFPDTLSLQIHLMVSHASKDWRHCGLCNYEFYSENGGTPNHLRLVKFSPDNDPAAKTSLPLLNDSGRSIDAWPLPAELMWRMIMTHETRHKERLFQPRPVPYLPLTLLDQLINGKAIQAVIAANWLIRKAQEEIEGVHAIDEPLPNVPDLIETEVAFSDGPNKVKQLEVDETAVEEAKTALINILRKNDEVADDSDYENAIRTSNKRVSSLSGNRLPHWLARKLTELGELNATRQVELDFAENL